MKWSFLKNMKVKSILLALTVSILLFSCEVLASGPNDPEDTGLSLQKRQVPLNCYNQPTGKCSRSYEGQAKYRSGCSDVVWICKSGNWTPFGLTPKIGLSANTPGSSCKDIQKRLTGHCDETPGSGEYYVQDMKVYCDMTTDDGGWTLVWKHSYIEITNVTQNMDFNSSFYKACVNLRSGPDGWCNIPNKARFEPDEMMIVAYHKGTVVYAYKGYFNRNIDYHWTGGILLEPKKIVDHCTASNGVAPEPDYSNRSPSIMFDKAAPYKYTGNCDTIRIDGPPPYRARSDADCRWGNCRLPSSISKTTYHVQMTYAIFVR